MTDELKFVDRTFQKLLSMQETEQERLSEDKTVRYIPIKTTFIEEYRVPVLDK